MNIEIHALTKVYPGGVQALQGVDLTISTGMFGLLGPNGAGKTTLMRILAGIVRPSSGQIRIGSYDLSHRQDREAVKWLLGYLPQEVSFYPDLSALDFLDYIGSLKGLTDRTKRSARVKELLEAVGLADAAKRKLRGFSGGMKRRVGIAQALLTDPQLLIVDEPTSGLDPEERVRFRNLLAELGGNRIVVLSTHIVEDIAQTCSQLAVMKRGHLAFQGTANEVIAQARGHVWDVTTQGNPPQGDLTIVSTVKTGKTTAYRVVGTVQSSLRAVPSEPSLEDGYMWLMRDGETESVKQTS